MPRFEIVLLTVGSPFLRRTGYRDLHVTAVNRYDLASGYDRIVFRNFPRGVKESRRGGRERDFDNWNQSLRRYRRRRISDLLSLAIVHHCGIIR
jgi:hypothetical protein